MFYHLKAPQIPKITCSVIGKLFAKDVLKFKFVCIYRESIISAGWIHKQNTEQLDQLFMNFYSTISTFN